MSLLHQTLIKEGAMYINSYILILLWFLVILEKMKQSNQYLMLSSVER